jgi:hypothetical protein
VLGSVLTPAWFPSPNTNYLLSDLIQTNQRTPHCPSAGGDSGTVSKTYTSTSLARLPLQCAVRRSVRLSLERYRFPIGAVISLIVISLYGRYMLIKNQALAQQIPALVEAVLEKLARQQQISDEDEDPFLSLPNLRDDVLRDVYSLRQRNEIFERVKAVVEQNSNVRVGVRESLHGEVGPTWEWVGPLPGDGVRRRRSGRVSLYGNEATKSEYDTPGSDDKSQVHQKWEESRPIY